MIKNISLLSIVLNEEEVINKWLDVYDGEFEDIVIVDGGSHDKTVDLIKARGIKPYFRKWDHNFSAQRNFAIDCARNDWCLFMDADEYATDKLINVLPKLTDSTHSVYRFYRYNYVDGKPFEQVFKEHHYKLFRKSSGLRWFGKIHEQMYCPGKKVSSAVLEDGYYLIHDKPLNRATKRWEYYNKQFYQKTWLDRKKEK